MWFNDFEIYSSGIYNYETKKTLPFKRFITNKGKWSKRLIKYIGEMDNKDLNKFVDKYSSKFNVSKDILASEVYDISPTFKNQKKMLFYDDKFYVAKTFKKISLADAVVDKRKVIPQQLIPDEEQYKNYLTQQAIKLNNGEINEMTINPLKISIREAFLILKNNVVDKKLISSIIGDDTTWIVLSDKTINNIIKKVNAVGIDEVGKGSDINYVYNFFNANLGVIVKAVQYDNTYSNSNQPKIKVGGKFFKYHHNIQDLNLEKCGIFYHGNLDGKLYKNYLNDNCLWWALSTLGLSYDKLEDMKLFVKNRIVPMSCLPKLCEKLKIQIKLKRLQGKRKDNYDNVSVEYFGKKYDEIYDIGLLDEHYFAIVDVPITSYALINYSKLQDLVNWESIYKTIFNKSKTKTLYKRDEGRYLNSFSVVKYLLQNKKTHLEKIKWTDDLLDTQFYDKIDTFGSLNYHEDNIKINPLSVKERSNLIDLLPLPLSNIKKEYRGFVKGKPDNEWNTYLSILFPIYKEIWDKFMLLITEYEDKTKWYKVYFDFETYADKNDGLKHKPYLACFITEDGEKRFFTGENCARKLLDNLPTENDNILLIAHNAGYDYRFLFNLFNPANLKPITKGSGLMSCDAEYIHNFFNNETGKKDYRKIKIRIKDSYKLIPEPLRKFGKMFGLKQGKEIIPYKYYNYVFSKYGINNIHRKTTHVYKHFIKECGVENWNDFKENCKKWNCFGTDGKGNETINIMLYSRMYCEIDCEVLKNGYEIFKKWICELGENSPTPVDLNIDNIISIASLSHKYLISQGCYEGVNQMSGKPREFIQRCVVGGRTMTNSNKKWKLSNCKIADFDACSLYPSAIFLGKGFLKGSPKVITDTNLNRCLNLYDGIFVRAIIKKIGINRQFPLASVMTDEGVRNFTNNLVGEELYLDKQSILDLIEFQGAEIEIIEGYYFHEGHNIIARDVMKYVYETRKEKKKEGNPIQAVYKLIMNSAYGKSILKPITSDIEIVPKIKKDKETGEFYDNWNTYLGKNYNHITEMTELKKCWIVKKHKPIIEHFNNAHVGVEILSSSKNIMNKVMCLAEDLKLKLYTQDTDSIHIDYDEVEILRSAYNSKYNTELIGKEMGQFHIDFELEGSVGEIWATACIFLGKKCYIDKLESIDKDGNKIVGYHIRMKGITSKSIDYTADLLYKEHEDKYLKLYEELYNGEKINFDLLCGGKVDLFKGGKDVSIRTYGYKPNGESEFSREVQFKYEEGVFAY